MVRATRMSIPAMAVFASSFSAALAADPCRVPGHQPAEAITASWYGREHHGQKMANGSRFDERQFTAAHPSLPLDSRVHVTNLANGSTIEVTITDRGPGYGRGIDLSEGAAEALGMRQCGLARVLVSAEAIVLPLTRQFVTGAHPR